MEPYDVTLTKLGVRERREWSDRVLESLERELGTVAGLTFEVHAGAAYSANGLASGLGAGAQVEIPTEGLSLGRQLAFYHHHVE